MPGLTCPSAGTSGWPRCRRSCRRSGRRSGTRRSRRVRRCSSGTRAVSSGYASFEIISSLSWAEGTALYEYRGAPGRMTRAAYGADGRGRTGTLSPAADFESATSANSITSAYHDFVIISDYARDCKFFLVYAGRPGVEWLRAKRGARKMAKTSSKFTLQSSGDGI